MSKILLIDDEPDILEFLKYNLEQEGYQVITGTDGQQALDKISENPDLIVLDIMMPKLDGFEVMERIRADKRYKDIPVIFLTAKAGEVNEIKGLELGAIDYIQKPISPKKLIARVKANLKKSDLITSKKDKLPERINFGPIVIDRKTFSVFIDDEKIYFPRKEFEILFFLLSNPERVFNREILLKEIWGNDVFVVDRTVDVHVRKIREKLGKYADMIETIKGVGYKVKSVE
ncbi:MULTISPECIES: response regulator transcription factor [Ignavibacterium]|jgi:two-component system alkaline phosphatase synthesis response regulator PhoP|uniref:response regulator n=1 Tax=Ignavibacterium TaxID=795750 RepID=UPI0025BD6CDE|nr:MULTISPECIES: response regulator transcription factor [Ignavibacterium]MBI5663283.1 response regulator transcription factor [Ignavibacterium album]